MVSFMMGLGVKRPNGKKPGQATSRKGCMKGKGGPENASCPYKGVRQRSWGRWVSEIREPNCGRRRWLGSFDSSHEAAMAYDDAACKLYGPAAKLNFPELTSATQLPATQLPATQLPPSSGSSLTECPENAIVEREAPCYQISWSEGLSVNPLFGVNTESMVYDNNYAPEYDNTVSMVYDNNSAPEYDNTETMVYDNNSAPEYDKVEMNIHSLSENLNANLPEFDNSSIWAEAIETMDFQALADPGLFYDDFEDEINSQELKYPWGY